MALLRAWTQMAEGFLAFQRVAAYLDYSDLGDASIERAVPHLEAAEQHGTALYSALGNLAACLGLPRTLFRQDG